MRLDPCRRHQGQESLVSQPGAQPHHHRVLQVRLAQGCQGFQQLELFLGLGFQPESEAFESHAHGVAHHPFAIVAAPQQGQQSPLPHGGALVWLQRLQLQAAKAAGGGTPHTRADIAGEGLFQQVQASHIADASQGSHCPGPGAVIAGIQAVQDRLHRHRAQPDQAIDGGHGSAGIVEAQHFHQAGDRLAVDAVPVVAGGQGTGGGQHGLGAGCLPHRLDAFADGVHFIAPHNRESMALNTASA